MLHTKTHKSRKLIIIRQFTPECINCIGCEHSSLCYNCQNWNTDSLQCEAEIDDIISAIYALEQENVSKPNERIINQIDK